MTDAELAAAITSLVDSDAAPPPDWRGDTRYLFDVISWPDTYDELVAAVLRVWPDLDADGIAAFRIGAAPPPRGVGAYEQPSLRPYTAPVTGVDAELDRITVSTVQPGLPLGA